MQNRASLGADRDRERIGNRVIHGDEFALERAKLLDIPLLHGERVRLDAVLAELRLDKGEGQLATDERDVRLEAQKVGNCTDVVLVAVCEHDRGNVVKAILDRAEVREDKVNARLGFFGKENAAIDDEEPALILEDGHVSADLAETAERGHT